MKFLQPLKEGYQSYNSHGRPILKWAGIVGAVAFPLFYALHLVRATKDYDNIWLRALGALMCLGLVLREHWPERLRPYYLGWSYATFIYCMPFFFIFMALKNGGGTIGVANTFMALFFLILLTDWRNTLVMLFVGALGAVAAYVLTTANPVMPQDYVGRWAPFVLVVIGGSILKFSQEQIQAVRLDALTGLAGSIAHEMRHPLGQVQHSLRAISELLPAPLTHTAEHPVTSPALESLYRQIAAGEQAVHRGLQVVSMTLDEVKSKPPDSASFSLISAAEATRRALAEFGFESAADRDRVLLEVSEDFTFHGDETAYIFVLFNLMKNALFYVPTRPHMLVTITVQKDCVTFRDTGPGIPPEIVSRLFQPFVTAEKSGGTGLGLAYCRRVMRAFGGDITCTSELDQYTQFILRFPPLDKMHANAHEAALVERARLALRGRRVLVVDDDEALRLTTQYKLKATEALIDQAGDGFRAVEALLRNDYELVLLDLNMPVMDGYEFAEVIRSGRVPGRANVPIVAYTSDPPHLARVKTRKVGMDGFVSKPATRAQLLKAILAGIDAASRRNEDLLGGRRIILADDSAFNRKAVAGYLRHAGAIVVEAEHGQAVLDELRRGDAPDAVLMDINMPEMTGLEAARMIRGLGAPMAGVPIIALTARSDAQTIHAARLAGMDDFITKPVGPELLYEKMARVISGAAPRLEEVSTQSARRESMESLLNVDRLESHRRIGMLGEMIDEYLPAISGLVGKLQRQASQKDLQACTDTMHSLVGMSGEVGSRALFETVRRIYIPMVEDKCWPADPTWVGQIVELSARTEKALKDYAASTNL